MALSPKQQAILEYITACVKERGYPPSVREIGAEVGLRSPSTVHTHLNALEESGYIVRDPGKTRAIMLTESVTGGVPIIGAVAAGQPILAARDIQGYLPYETDDNGDYFALEIRGDSMQNAGILDGDMVVVRAQQTAWEGDIIIAAIEEEATCKRLHYENGRPWLLPENEDYSPIDGRAAQIIGKVAVVIRRYL